MQRAAPPAPSTASSPPAWAPAAVDRLAAGEKGVLVGVNRGEITTTPLAEVVSNRKPLDLTLFELARILAR